MSDDGRITVYSTETGEASRCHAVDARQRVLRGGWSYDPVQPVPLSPVYTEPTAEEVAAEPAPLEFSVELEAQLDAQKVEKPKGKPGRKPRSAS